MTRATRPMAVVAVVAFTLGVTAVGVTSAAAGTAASPAPVVEKAAAHIRGPLMRIAKHRLHRLVHAEVTVDRPEAGIVTIALDHGTVTAISTTSISVRRSDDAAVTIATDGDTKVRVDREPGALTDVKPGDEVLVRSRTTDGSQLAKRIVVVPHRQEGPDSKG